MTYELHVDSTITTLFNFDDEVTSHQIVSNTPGHIPQSPNHTWLRESLISVLSSDALSRQRKIIPGGLERPEGLVYCTNTDLLDMLMNIVIGVEGPSSCEPFIAPIYPILICHWCLLDGPHDFLRRLLASHHLHGRRFSAFAKGLMNLFRTVFRIEGAPLSAPRMGEIVKLAFELLEIQRNGNISESEATRCLKHTVALQLPDISSKLIAYGGTVRYLFSFPPRMLFSGPPFQVLSPPMTAFVLQMGADAQDALRGAWFHLRHLPTGSGSKDLEHLYHMFYLPLAHGADPDQQMKQWTFGMDMSIAEWAALRSSTLGRIFLPFVKNKYRQEMIQTFLDLHEQRSIIGASPSHREFALLIATATESTTFAERLLRVGTDPNCSSILSTGSWKATDPIVKEFTRRATAYRVESLVDWSLSRSNGTMVKILLDGSRTGESYIKRIHNSTIFRHREMLRSLIDELSEPHRLPYTQSCLLRLAILDKNAELLIGLDDAGVPMNMKLSPMDRDAALGFAIRHSTFSTVQLLWDLGARFRDSGPSGGAYELVQLFSDGKGEEQDFLTKFEFLTMQGACVSASVECNNDNCLIFTQSPFQSLVRHVSRCNLDYSVFFETMKRLIAVGIPLHRRDTSGQTPLQIAAKWGVWHVMKYLIDHGADVNANICGSTSESPSPLAFACSAREPSLVNYDLVEDPVSREQIIHMLLDYGADINQVFSRGTALGKACGSRCLIAVRILLDRGASIDLPSYPTWAVVRESCFYDRTIGVSVVAPAGDIDRSMTPLQIACHRDATELQEDMEYVKHLLAHGANPNTTPCETTPTALQLAAKNDDLALARILIEAGATSNDSNLSAIPALHHAIVAGNFSMALLLIESGADVNLGVDYDRWPIFSGFREMYPLTALTGVYTAVELAAYKGHHSIVQLVINAGAEKEATTDRFCRAIDIARSEQHLEVVELLESQRQATYPSYCEMLGVDFEDNSE